MASLRPSSPSLNFLRSSGVVSLLNFLSRITGFIREMLKARFLGTSGLADAFQLAFMIPNLFRRLTAEGVMLSTFLPIFSEVEFKEGKKGAEQFLNVLFWWLSLILIGFSGVYIFFADFFVHQVFARGFQGETLQSAILFSRIMFGYIALISIAALLQGVLNHHRTFWISASTPIFLNIIVIGFGCGAWLLHKNIATAFSWGVLLGGLVQVLLQLPYVFKLGYGFYCKRPFSHPYLKKMLKISLPGVIGAGIYQIDIVISNVIASSLEEGSIASLNFSNRMLELVLGVFIVSQTTVFLPHIVQRLLEKKTKEASQELSSLMGLISFLTLPAIISMLLCANSIIRLLFENGKFNESSVQLTLQAFFFHVPGMLAIGWNRALVTIYQARKLFRLTMLFAFWTMLWNVIFALALSKFYGNGGIALANTMSQYFQLLLLVFYLYKKTKIQVDWEGLFFKILPRHFFSVLAMAMGILGAEFLKIGSLWLLFSTQILMGGSLFFASAYFLKTKELEYILQMLGRKRK